MERSSIKMMAAAMVITVMLTGCGDKNDAQPANNGQAADRSTGGAAASSGLQQPDRTADYFAKVVKVSGDSIIVQKSTVSPADMPAGGGFGGRQGGGQRPNRNGGSGDDGQQGQQVGNADSAPQSGGNGGTGGEQGNGNGTGDQNGGKGGRQGGRFGGGFMNQMKFADEQTTVPINGDTEIVTVKRSQDGITNETLKAADLKEGDVLSVWMGADNTTAAYIMLRFNPANMGNQGKAGNAK
ncbi:hypothetical protein [Paenibacillus sp. R14(2021)]|uniref:hypothetical protein n=1 Tax=Paenibacillus sp. R14(2021) TaxID=2859228 RepID=UPI001C6162AD|nr:hypothetical protein [Paenibacillus sp. R14(2021)]